MNKIGLLFGGQGQQVIGMEQCLINKSDIYSRANDILDYDLINVSFNEQLLNQTIYTQPALLTFNHGLYELLENKINIEYVAGLSLGEYNALLASDVLSFNDALRLVNKRASIMSNALPPQSSKMVALLKVDISLVEDILSNNELKNKVKICNYNTNDQIVIGGKSECVDKAIEYLKKNGIKRIVELDVSIASHMNLLDDASKELEIELKKYKFEKPNKKLISNISGEVEEDNFVMNLSRHISNATYMNKSIELMLEDGVNTFIEIAPKKALLGFVKTIAKQMNKEVNLYLISDVQSLNEVVNEVNKNGK
ncbi:MAG: ACP S-malonyltransferase [Erysipelotrichales bacterium]